MSQEESEEDGDQVAPEIDLLESEEETFNGNLNMTSIEKTQT